MSIGIYKLNFTGTDKVYIGQSRRLEKRLAEHLALFRSGNHSRKMQAAYLEFGSPTLEVLCECTIEELKEFENETIEIWDAVNNGFNSAYKAGEYAPMYGELHGNSKYSNLQILEVLDLLVQYPPLTFNDITKITGVSLYVISDISSIKTHNWLLEASPIKYNLLVSLKGNRNKGDTSTSSVYSNSKIIEVFNLLTEDTLIGLHTISNITKVSYCVVASISSGNNHTWLKDMYPDKYKLLINRKGLRSSVSNSAISKGIVYPLIQDPDGNMYSINNTRKFAMEHNLNPSHLGKVLNGKAKTHRGWKLAESKE